MTTLVFPLAGCLLLAEHALAATSHAASMREVLDGTPARPALWLVGDHGVFLMSNGLLTPAHAEHTTGLPAVHAAGYPTEADWLAVAHQIGRGTRSASSCRCSMRASAGGPCTSTSPPAPTLPTS